MAITNGVAPFDAVGFSASPAGAIVGTTIHHSVAVMFRWGHATSTLSAVDCSGQSMSLGTVLRGTVGGQAYSSQIAYLNDLSSGGNKVITATLSATSVWGVNSSSWAGGDLTTWSAAEPSGGGSTGSSTLATTTLTTPNANAMIIGQVMCNSTTIGIQSGYTGAVETNLVWYEEGQWIEDVGTAGSKSFEMGMLDGTRDWVIQCMAFNASGGGGGSIRISMLPILGVG